MLYARFLLRVASCGLCPKRLPSSKLVTCNLEHFFNKSIFQITIVFLKSLKLLSSGISDRLNIFAIHFNQNNNKNMCGRFSFAPELKIVNEHYNITVNDGDINPNYNCTPGQLLPVISNNNPGTISKYFWGLIPFWAKDKNIGYKMINSRGETITEKMSFKNAFKKRRCLVPADAFYEWQKKSGSKEKIPYRVFLPNQPVFSMAGIWEQWKNPEGEYIRSFSIVTTSPNELMAEIHNRMPVILTKESEKQWLESDDEEGLLKLIKPYEANKMEAHRVSTLVNSPRNNSKEIIKPVKIG